jgi:hypothetical protein
MKKHFLIFLAIMPLALFGQENNSKQVSVGFNIWNELSESSGSNYIRDSITRNFNRTKSGFKGIKPFVEIRLKNQKCLQLGISKLNYEKELYDYWDYKIGTPTNDSSKFYGKDFIQSYEELRYGFECFGTYKYQPKNRFIPTFFLQATLGFQRTKNQPFFSDIFPRTNLNISSTFSPGLEYSLSLSNKITFTIGTQIPLFRFRLNYKRVEMPTWDINSQRSLQMGFTTENLLYPQLRLGLNFKI